MNDYKRSFWNDVAMTGLYVGFVLILSIAVSYLMRASKAAGMVGNLITIAAVFIIPYFRGRLFASGLGEFPFFNALKYAFVSLLFSGILYGIAMYVMYNHVAPGYYLDEVTTAMGQLGAPQETTEQAIEAYYRFVTNPVSVILISIFSMVLVGFFPALIVAVLIRKNPQPGIPDNQKEEA